MVEIDLTRRKNPSKAEKKINKSSQKKKKRLSAKTKNNIFITVQDIHVVFQFGTLPTL